MVDRNRLMEELRRMKQLINSDPKVLARFDLDGNGVIDGDEWDQVRKLVTKRLEREEAEAAEAERLAAEAGAPDAAASAAGTAAGAGVGAVAAGIFSEDLVAGAAVGSRSIEHLNDLVLEQQGGLAQLAEGVLKRNYQIKDLQGQVLGQVNQHESELLQNLTNKSIFDLPELHFNVTTVQGQLITFERSQGMASSRIEVFAGGASVAVVTWTFSILKRKYSVTSLFERGALSVQGKLFKPFTMEIRNDIGELIGSVQRSWSGLGGFLTGGNRMRIHIEPGRVSPNQRWGLLAAALLEDLGAERRR